MFLTDRWIYGAQVVSYRSREQDGQTGISPPGPLVHRGIARWLAAHSGQTLFISIMRTMPTLNRLERIVPTN